MNGVTLAWDGLAPDVDVALLQKAPRPSNHVNYTVSPAVDGEWRTVGWKGSLWQRSTAISAPSGQYDSGRIPSIPWRRLWGPASRCRDWERGGLRCSGHRRPGRGHRCFGLRVLDARFGQRAVDFLRCLSPCDPERAESASARCAVASRDSCRRLEFTFGYSEGGNSDRDYWRARHASVFARAEALGLTYVGPPAPNGRQAEPWPVELPADSHCVPTYHTRP